MTAAVAIARPAFLPPADARQVVVEASAGTGKTFFLEHRVVDLILAGAELGQILVVTFTDKAVAELRLRIRDLLDRLARADASTAADGAPAWQIGDDERRRLRAAITAFDYAPIHTIHGYCHRLLIEDAFAARRLFEQTQIADEVAFDAAFTALVRERFAHRAPDRDLLGAFLTSRTAKGAPRHLGHLGFRCHPIQIHPRCGHIPMEAPEGCQQRPRQRHRARMQQAQHARLAPRQRPGVVRRAGQLRIHPRHPRPEQLAPRRETHAPRLAHEERHPQLLLQRGDLPAQGRLRHKQPGRRQREIAGLRHGQEITDLPEANHSLM